MVQENLKIININRLNDTVLHYSLFAPKISQEAKAGQFININVSPTPHTPLLKRPISIFHIDSEKATIDIIFQIRGQGTNILANKTIGVELDVIGPLGRGFTVGDYKNIAIVGGGIGIFPLYQLAKEYSGKANITTYLGFRDKSQVLLENEFSALSNSLIVTTDDGSYGEKGNVVSCLQRDMKRNGFDAVFACGPSLMLSAIQSATKDKNILCEVSLEERMGCAIGACMGCSVELQESVENHKYARVCKDGPVFEAKEIIIGGSR